MKARPHGGRTGIAIAAAGVLGAWADLAWPWLLAQGPTPGTLRTVLRAELVQRGPLPYERALFDWPLACWALCIVAGGAAAWMSRSSSPAFAHWRRALWGAAAAAGFVALLTGMRWLGFYLARLWDSGPSPVHLHIVPYLHAALGAGVLAAS
ncbi:MAG TPA: hypothetical protein VHI93_05360, partial [Candidatus Thermoplasmatota archaeon]|nr:hypothetical protein [Candidatus Thermoplasmatota archaeon]